MSLQVAARNVSGCVGMCRDVSQCVETGWANLLVTQRVNFKNYVEEENRLLVEARKGATRHQTSLRVKRRIFALLQQSLNRLQVESKIIPNSP
jgi:hypothetical protein